MKVGEVKNISLQPAEGYGAVEKNKIHEVHLNQLPEGIEVGNMLQTADGLKATVVEIIDEKATIDMNHPMAGKVLNFEITLREVRDTRHAKKKTCLYLVRRPGRVE